MEVVACLLLMKEKGYIPEDVSKSIYADCEKLSAKILAMKNAIQKRNSGNFVNEVDENLY
jgi:hypothetical protein